MNTEADTCHIFFTPRLQAAGWDNAPHAIHEQRSFTDGRVVFVGGQPRRGRGKRTDYLLRYRPDVALAGGEAKASYLRAEDGLQQAKDDAEILGLNFAYATNGAKIPEFDFFEGLEPVIEAFPTPAELWTRQHIVLGLTDHTLAYEMPVPSPPVQKLVALLMPKVSAIAPTKPRLPPMLTCCCPPCSPRYSTDRKHLTRMMG